MVLSDPKMDDDDDLEALRLAALQTIRPRTSRNITTLSTNDKAKFFRPSSNPNLIAIVPLDSRNKLNSDKPILNSGESAKEVQSKLAKILPQSVYSNPKIEEKNEVSSKFSRFRDSGSHSDEDSWDEDDTFTTTKKVEEKVEETEPQRPGSEHDDVLHLDDGDDDSLEKLMDQMEEEFNRSEPKKDDNSSEIKTGKSAAKSQKEKPANKSGNKTPGDKNVSDGESNALKKTRTPDRNNEDTAKKNNSLYPSRPSESLPARKKSPCRTSPNRYRSKSPPDDLHSKSRRSPLSSSRRSPPKKLRSPVRRSRSPRRYSSRSISPRRRSPTPRRRHNSSRSPTSRSRTVSPKQWYSTPKRQSLSPWRRSRSPRGISMSPRRLSSSPRRGSVSPRRRSISPRKLSVSPRRKSLSPRRRGVSLRRSSVSPRRSLSPRRLSHSPRQRSNSPRRRSFSPGRKSLSPRRRRKSPVKSISPRENLSRKRGRSPRLSPKRQSLSPRRRKGPSPKPKNSPRRRSVSPRRAPRSPRRSPARSPTRIRNSPDRIKSRKVPEAKRSPLNSIEGRGKIQGFKRRANFSTKTTKNGNSKHDGTKKVKEPRKKEEKKASDQLKSETNLNPILEARRRKFESNSVVAPANKKIRLCPVSNQNEKGEPEPVVHKKSILVQKKQPLKESVIKDSDDGKNEARKVEDDPLSPDLSSNDVLFLEADYSFDDIEEPKEKEPVVEPTIKIRKIDTQTSAPIKKTGRKIITLHEDRPIVQKRKISVNIKPTALLVLEEKSKKLSEHKLTQEKREKNQKGLIDKIVSPTKISSSEDTIGKKFQQRQLKAFKEPESDVGDGPDKEPGDSQALDLRAELSRRRAERMKGGMNPASRLLQSAFEGLIGKKPVRVKRITSPENELTIIKKQSVTTGKGRRVKVVQRGDSPLESGSQDVEYTNENIRDSQRNSHLNSQSGRSILHRNQV